VAYTAEDLALLETLIVVAEATLARLGPDVAAEDLGVRELKNVETPLRLFRLQWFRARMNPPEQPFITERDP
jgi:class 3 adenylate cyclase